MAGSPCLFAFRRFAFAPVVQNFNTTHMEEIKAAGLPMPSVNQSPLSPDHGPAYKGCTPGTVEETCGELIKYCQDNNIVFNSYSPFGGTHGELSPPARSDLMENTAAPGCASCVRPR